MPDLFHHIPLSLLIFLLVALVLLSNFTMPILRLFGWRKRSHRQKERQARRSLAVLTTIQEPGRKFAYLRKVDPFVFEEMILEAYEQQGYKVKRNHRYTGDGGIDGRVYLDGQLHLIQAKRYAGHISAAHVREFCQIVAVKGCKGIFVHTGRTGSASHYSAKCNGNVTIISGQRLLDLLTVHKG
ncbi:restriction endonuclease [Vreelandella nigrificans]|uniref:Restriction endonuclease n=1 Tax=Vreelandella nigrificans TaxID=2042704 RepID=A0A2A4HJ26_9GAMM|nr:restriction endonuclease [Halomonas nigrificans]PCF94101.1 restriction endonuclease [Halomonas nigrificans]